jgi:hypothetical protein
MSLSRSTEKFRRLALDEELLSSEITCSHLSYISPALYLCTGFESQCMIANKSFKSRALLGLQNLADSWYELGCIQPLIA